MSAKKGKRKIETRTVLYILLVLVIIGGAYVFISSQEEMPTYYSPSYVLKNSDRFIEENETIIIKGYWDANVVEGGGLIDDFQDIGSGEITNVLKLDYTNVLNASTKLDQNLMLLFTGKLAIDPSNPLAIIFEATEITRA